MKRLSLLLVLILTNVLAFAQSSGFIDGKVTKGGKPLQGVIVEAYDGGILKGRDETDQFGKYQIKPLGASSYEVKFNYSTANQEIASVLVSDGSGTTQNMKMTDKKNTLNTFTIKKQRIRPALVIDPNKAGQTVPIDAKKIERLATTNTVDATNLVGGGYQAKKGGEVKLGGGRAENTIYIIDGAITRNGNPQVNPGNIQEISVNIGGLPASLGDATGGVVTINTKGASATHVGSINFQHSIDGFNNNQLNVNLRGPLLKKKNYATDEAGNIKRDANGKKMITTSRPIVGYSLSLGGQWDKDNDPSYYKYTVINPTKLAELQANPLQAVLSQSGTGIYYRNAAEFVTPADLTTQKARPNGYNHAINIQGKLTFAPTKDIDITIGGNTQMSANPAYSNSNSIFAPEANAVADYFLGRGYLRFRQTLSKGSQEKTLISKAYYTVQLNYEKTFGSSQNKKFGDNIFQYGYLGKFTQNTTNYYAFDTVAGGYKCLKNYGSISSFDSLTFTPNDSYNPNYTAYTKYIYNSLERAPYNINSLMQIGGLVNGGYPNSVFGLYSNVGSNVGSLSKYQRDQYSMNVDASFDINTGIKKSKKLNLDLEARHSIEFGFYYEQRVNRDYALAGNGLWDLMRTITNSHLTSAYDLSNPIFRVDGKDYTLAQVQSGVVSVSPFDTVNYQHGITKDATESFFSKNIRQALGLPSGNKDWINIDQVDPSILKLNMFSADDLYNPGGSAYVNYSGYDYLGNKVTGRPSFNDFWTKTNSNGVYSRPVAPFNPIYLAGYIQDNFKFKDIRFRIGMRVDRYDANQKVLRDPYSLVAGYQVNSLKTNSYTLAQDPSRGNATAPDPLKDADFAAKFSDANVYVDDNKLSKPKIVAYRIGDVWYDPFGTQIADPSIINTKYTNGSQMAPYIVNKSGIDKNIIKSASYDVNSAFTGYVPRVNISPRITFSFPVDLDINGNIKSMFYAHYDVVTQRPTATYIYATPDDYYFMSERAGSQTLANANLSPEKKVDYEFGFQQQISKSSLLKLSAAYIERRNQVQLQTMLSAYPITYQTYGNRDFSTVKQMICQYELRPDRIPLEMTLAYTLQFAEGTGSNATSQRGLLASGQPNLRTVQPLDIDSRHTLVINTDYRFGADTNNSGPQIGRFHPFRNVGLNLTGSARSGEPYTRLQQVQSLYSNGVAGQSIAGTFNGSRRPWSFNLDARIDKDIVINKRGKKLEDGSRGKSKPLGLNVYCTVQNVLNTRNVLAVYSYTGLSDNDGFVASASGAQYASNVTTNAASWAYFYNLAVRNPARFVNPRRIFIGFNFNF